MITSQPDHAHLEHWKKLWEENKDSIIPNRRNGHQLVEYLSALYSPEESIDNELLNIVRLNVTENDFYARKLNGQIPLPAVFFVKNEGNGAFLYDNRSSVFADVEQIMVGIDLVSGYYHVEGSEHLWDELCAYQGLDKDDLKNYVRTGQYLECVKDRGRIIGKKVTVSVDRSLGSTHPRYPDIIYPVNYGYVKGIAAADGDWQDAYILGIDEPVTKFDGIVTAVIHRSDDCEDKWVVVPDGLKLTYEQIAAMVEFQEKYFKSQIIL